MISHACGLVLLVTASSAFLQRVNGVQRHAAPPAMRCCSLHQCILWCVCVYLRAPLCHSTCCLFQVAKQSCFMLSMMLRCACVRRWRRLPSCSSRQGVCRVTSRPPSPVTSNMMRLTSHKMSLKRPKRYHHALPPFPHKRSSTTVQIGGPEMHAIACFLCSHVGSNAVEVMPCTYTVYSHVEQ
jgi:hypothetical protein